MQYCTELSELSIIFRLLCLELAGLIKDSLSINWKKKLKIDNAWAVLFLFIIGRFVSVLMFLCYALIDSIKSFTKSMLVNCNKCTVSFISGIEQNIFFLFFEATIKDVLEINP